MDGVALVTGGAGFVGANLVRRLIRDGLDVHVVLHSDVEPWRLSGVTELTRHRCSVTDSDTLVELVGALKPEWVFHLAAHGAYSSQTNRDRITAVNTTGTFNLLDAVTNAGGCNGFVHTGSSSEYGLKNHAPSEDEAVAPNSIYAITKCAATHAVSYWAREHALPAVTLRLYSVYGYWEQPSRLMPRLVSATSSGKLPPLTHPTTTRDFVWIDDVIDAIVRAAKAAANHAAAIWNIGSGVQTTLHELVAMAREMFDVRQEPAWDSMPSRLWDTDCWVADISRARSELGWEPATDLRSGLLRMAEWLSAPPQRTRYAGAVSEGSAQC